MKKYFGFLVFNFIFSIVLFSGFAFAQEAAPADSYGGLIQQISERFEKEGSDSALQFIRDQVNEGLTREAFARNSQPGAVITTLEIKAHPNSAEAVDFLNEIFKSIQMPFQFVLIADSSLPDPYLPSEASKRAYNSAKWGRFLSGPAMIGLGMATGQTPMIAPVLEAAGAQTIYEVQFASPWIDRNVWTPLFHTTAKARKLLLGLNPGILAVNFLYPWSLYEILRWRAGHYNIDPTKLVSSLDRGSAYALMVVGALIFTTTYGRFQDDQILQRARGQISEGSRYIRTSLMNFAANGFRATSIFVPLVVAKMAVGGAEMKVDLGLLGLLALGLAVTTPMAIKTAFGHKARTAYINAKLNSNASPTQAISLRTKCLAVLDRLANPMRLRKK